MPILFPVVPLIQLDPEEVRRNVRITSIRSLQETILPEDLTSSSIKGDVVAIIGGGPSLLQKVPGWDQQTILDRLNARTDVIKVLAGSAHQLLDTGKLTWVDAAVFNLPDPKGINKTTGQRASYADHIHSPCSDITYYLASQCDPRLFDYLKRSQANMRVFHAYVKDAGHAEDKIQIGAGSTAVTAAVALFRALGYRNFEFYGVDGGRKMKPEVAKALIERHESPGKGNYAYPMPEERIADDTIIIEVGEGEYYSTTQNFWEQTQELLVVMASRGYDLRLHFHGKNTLSAALLKEPSPGMYTVYDLSRPRTLEPGFEGSGPGLGDGP